MSNIIGERFRQEIKWAGYTLERFAPLVGVSSKCVLSAMLKKNDDYWSYTQIKRFCDELGLPVQAIVKDVV